MLHAKKMRLVPYNEDEVLPTLSSVEPDHRINSERDRYFRITDSKTVQTPGTPLTRLDREMYDILHSDSLDDRDKWQIYRQILQKYLQKLPSKPEKKSLKIEGKKTFALTDEKIMESVPKKFKGKAKQLLDFARNLENVEWDETGAVKVHGATIKGNIMDLVNDAVRHRKNFTARGRAQFAAVLRQAGVPQEFVGNNQFLGDGSFLNNTNSDALASASPDNNVVNDALTGSMSYRDVSRMQIDTDTSPDVTINSPPSLPNASRVNISRLNQTPLRRHSSQKRAFEQSSVLEKTRHRKKKRCIYQPMKKTNYGGHWKRI